MVTKQQQLEWLAKRHAVWPGFQHNPLRMSAAITGRISNGNGPLHTITREEWQQERDKMQKKGEKADSWHERGELPPVGCECEWVDESGVDGAAGAGYPDIGDAVSICAHKQTPGGDVIAIFTWEPGGDGLSVAASRMPSDFRPLRTERDKAIDEMIAVISSMNILSIESIAEKLFDAGFRLEQSK